MLKIVESTDSINHGTAATPEDSLEIMVLSDTQKLDAYALIFDLIL